ncbi:NUDIX hydrolase [Pelagicoccus albus]|uniref:NUDIX hydrolase n=1 Tax=Pelagicoccus albus TaxID=415222 RepID=UPI0030DBD8EE
MPSVDNSSTPADLRFRIGVLLYFRDEQGRLLLIRRERPPNEGSWCAIGGKLEMTIGESPYECAQREAQEEVGLRLNVEELRLRVILSEKDYEKTGHWLMFVFQVLTPLKELPQSIEEGEFKFFESGSLDDVNIPELDRRILSKYILTQKSGLHMLRSDGEGHPLVEESRVSV